VVNAGISGSDVRNMMLEAVERRFGGYRASASVEMLSDNVSSPMRAAVASFQSITGSHLSIRSRRLLKMHSPPRRG
jgi:hypothetical protein